MVLRCNTRGRRRDRALAPPLFWRSRCLHLRADHSINFGASSCGSPEEPEVVGEDGDSLPNLNTMCGGLYGVEDPLVPCIVGLLLWL
jgi:hypothetical protein